MTLNNPFYLIFGIVFGLIGSCQAQIDKVCNHPLGMEDKRIDDYYLTASSSHARGTGPRYARLNRDEGDGAWCPAGNIDSDSEEYLEIELPDLYFITGIATQGRYACSHGMEFAKTYKIKYKRPDLTWITWSNYMGTENLAGNVDTNTVKRQSLKPGIAGVKYIRIYPTSPVPRPACIRVELYGCLWKSGLISYNILTPIKSSPSTGMFGDNIYDGWIGPDWLSRGLGQLADGIIGQNNIAKSSSSYQTNPYGYDFVGWNIGSIMENKNIPLSITFNFDQVRNFTSFQLFTYVDQSIGASSISVVYIYPSMNRVSFLRKPIASFNVRDVSGEKSLRSFEVPFRPYLITRTIKLVFGFANRRNFLLSEVEFRNTLLPPDATARYQSDPPWLEEGGGLDDDSDNPVYTQSPRDNSSHVDNTGMIVGVLVAVIIFLVFIVAGLFYRQRRLRKTITPPSYLFQTSNRGEPFVTLAPRLEPTPEHLQDKVPPIYQEISTTDLSTDVIYHQPKDAIRGTPPPPYQADENNKEIEGHIASDQATTSHYAEATLFSQQLHPENMQGVFGNNVYAVPWNTSPSKQGKRKESSKKLSSNSRNKSKRKDERQNLLKSVRSDNLPPEFPRERLEFIEKLGEGQFGEVHLCKADPLLRELTDDGEFTIPGNRTSPILVAVKILRSGASNNTREDFLKEVKVLSHLLHPKIVRLLAVCTDNEPFAMVTEYMEHGDLNQYLQTFDDELKPTPGKRVITTEILIKIAVQVAAGMEYLSSLNFVHRDLAARNCLVGSDDEIRIGDFGMSRNMYQSDYYRIEGKAVLPIRWMAWECIFLGKFSSASDVWAFGVTLWEIYSLCKYQPFITLNDEQVIENLQHFFDSNQKEVTLPRPRRCPASMYNMMRQCWKRETAERPTFSQLHTYLVERQQTDRHSPKPKRPQVKPPVPIV